MEKIKKYGNIISEIVKKYERADNPIETNVIIDEKNGHYQVLRIGWADRDTFMLRIILYFQIKPDGKIWILANWTEDEVEDILIENGVKKSDIVLGLFPEYIRPDTGFAVA